MSFTSYNFGSRVSEYKTEVSGTALKVRKRMVEEPPGLTVEPEQDKSCCAKLASGWLETHSCHRGLAAATAPAPSQDSICDIPELPLFCGKQNSWKLTKTGQYRDGPPSLVVLRDSLGPSQPERLSRADTSFVTETGPWNCP